jgi:predicted DNA-binding transcriptional regulator AlpA
MPDQLAALLAHSSAVNSLPYELARHRVLPTQQACEFTGVSVAQWRRLRMRGGVPAPIMIGARKQGWRLGDLIDWLASRKAEQPAA